MTTFCSIHVADNGIGGFLRSKEPEPEHTPGLKSAQRLTAAGFSGKQYPGAPNLGRNGFIAFWDSDAAIDTYLASESALPFAAGWNVRTEVTRAIGSWPGLSTDIDRSVHVSSARPVIGISLGPLRLSKGLTFNRLNTRIEAQLLESSGLMWASAFFAPRTILSTVTFWESAKSLHDFARSGAHLDGMTASIDRNEDPSLPNGTAFFAPDSVFMSLRPYRTDGSLGGGNPIDEDLSRALVSDSQSEAAG